MTLAAGLAVLGLLAQGMALPRIERVAWLQGCWELQRGDRTIEEQWLSPRGASMLGVGRTTRGTTLVEYELVLIRERGDHLSYEAHPSGQDPALFMSGTISDRSIVFENLKHDFPQRVGYERPSPDRLLAWIEGVQDGQNRRVEFDYQRVACAGD